MEGRLEEMKKMYENREKMLKQEIEMADNGIIDAKHTHKELFAKKILYQMNYESSKQKLTELIERKKRFSRMKDLFSTLWLLLVVCMHTFYFCPLFAVSQFKKKKL